MNIKTKQNNLDKSNINFFQYVNKYMTKNINSLSSVWVAA